MTESEFVAAHTGPAVSFSDEERMLLADAEFRVGLLQEIQAAPERDSTGLLRHILQLEGADRRNGDNEEYFENLYWCGFLLSRAGDTADVLPLWRAKNINFDTGCGFDAQMLVGAGVEETIRYLRHKGDAEANAAADYIAKCRASGDFDDLEGWAEEKAGYFG